MNHIYRRVYNHARGVWQVASELTSARRAVQGGATSSVVRPTWRLLCLASSLAMTQPAFAQIVADPRAPGHQRPTVLGVRGGAALINIQAPSAAGISRNTYAQLDVDQHGAVLNNSRTASQTRLAGTVAGNPWIGARTAKVILNEVTGPAPSSLRGHIEVAGERAHVIVANPAGIHCDGCGVINASRLTLTTGTPMLGDGALDGYRVTGGRVRIDGAGLDATGADYTEVIARAVEVNGGIWSPALQVSAGVTGNQASHADKPVFALDIGSLGGMYANKIVLLGTEHGVGVRNAGTIGAQAGDLVVTVDGRLENSGSLHAQADTTIGAGGGVVNSGSITAARQLGIDTPAALDNSGGTLKAGRLAVEAGALRNAGGTVVQTGAQGLSLQAAMVSNRQGGSIGIPQGNPADGAAEANAPAVPVSDGALRIAGRLDNDGGRIEANAGIDLTALDDLANDGGTLRLRRFTLTGGELSNRGGTLRVDGAARLQAARLLNDAGQLSFADALAFSTGSFSNRGGRLVHAGGAATTLSAAGLFDNSDGAIESNASQLTLASGTLINERGTVQHTGTDGIALHTGVWRGGAGTLSTPGAARLSASAVDHRGARLAARQVDITADSVDNRGGSMAASGDKENTWTVAGLLDNSGGTIASQGDLTLQAATLANVRGELKHAGKGTLNVHTTTLLGTGGAVLSQGVLELAGHALDLSEGTTAAQTVRLSATSLSTARGTLAAAGSDTLTLDLRGAYDNREGSVATNGALQLRAGSLTNRHGTLAATGTQATALHVTDHLDNAGGSIEAKGDLVVRAATFDNGSGTVFTPDALSIDSSSLLNTGGSLGSGGAATLNLSRLTNTNGRVQGDTVHLTTETLANEGGAIAANTLEGKLGTLTGLGTLHAANLLDVHVLGDYTHAAGQRWQGDGVFSVKVDGTLTNQGNLQTKGELRLAATNLVNRGAIRSSAADGSALASLSVTGRIDNLAGASIAGDTLTLAAADIHNSSREGITANVLRIEADTLTNGRDLGTADADTAYGEGFIGAAKSLDLRIGRQLANWDGDIYAGGDLVIGGRTDGARTARLDNISGRIQARDDAGIAADVIDNRKRVIETEQVALTSDEQHALSSARRYDHALTAYEQQRVDLLFRKNAGRKPTSKFRKKRKHFWEKGSGLRQDELTELMSYLYRSGWTRTEHVSDAELAILNARYRRIAIDEYGQRGGYLVVGPDGNPGAAYRQTDTYLTQTKVIRESADSQIVTGGNLTIDLGTRLTNHASAITASGDLHIDGKTDARIENIAVTGRYTIRRDVDALVLPSVPVRYLSRRGWKEDWANFPAHIGTETLTTDGAVLGPSTITGRTVTLVGRDIENVAVAAAGGIAPLKSASPRMGRHMGGIDGIAQGGAAQVIGSVEHPFRRVVVPSNGRVVRHTDAGAPFLVTTAPRFANGRAIGSDYLLRSLGTNAWQIHKRLGDGYVEQDLVLDQLLQLTGRRTLNGGDGIAQYTALMDHAAAQAQDLGFRLGEPLTTTQIAALSSDIVWLVEQVVDGQAVLVPVVYLSKNTAERMRADGALIGGESIGLSASGTLHNDGSIHGSRETAIGADTLINTGAIQADERLGIATSGDILNAGALGGQLVTIRAGGSVVNAPRFDGLAASRGKITAGAGGIHIAAAGDVINQGAIDSAGDATVVAGRDYGQHAAASSIGTPAQASSLSTAGHAIVVAGRDAVFDRSTVSTGQRAYVDAGRDAQFRAASISGGTGVGVNAGRDIVSDAVTERSVTQQSAKQRRHSSSAVTVDDTTRGSTFRSGGDLTLQAGRDIRLTASEAKAKDVVALTAGRDIELLAGENIHRETTESRTVKKKRFGKKVTTTQGQHIERTVVGTAISGEQGVVLDAGRDVHAVAATLTSRDGATILRAGNDIELQAASATTSTRQTVRRRSSGHTYGSKTVHTDTSLTQARTVGTTIEGRAGVVLDAGHDVSATGGTLRSATGIAITAGHEVALRAAYDIDVAEQSTTTRRAGFEHVPNDKQGTRKTKVQTQAVTPQGTTLDAADPIVVASGGNQTYQAANIHSDTGSALISGGAIHFQTATKSDTYQRASSKRNVAYQAKDVRYRVDTEEVQSRITGPLTVLAAEGVTVDLGRDPRATAAQKEAMRKALLENDAEMLASPFIGETEDEAVARQTTEPGYAWIADLRAQPGVTWNLVDETHIDDHQHHEGVTKAAAVVITVVATALTAGAASAAIGGTLGTASGSTFAAASTTAATATTAATTTAAGLGNAILSGAISGAVGGAVNAGSQGYDWKEGARKGAISGAVSGGLFHQAGDIASKYKWDDGSLPKSVLHAGAGGTASVLTGGTFWNGAVSAGFAEATGPYIKAHSGGTWGEAAGAAASGATASWLSGGNPEEGALSGLSGYLFNRLMHPAEKQAVNKLTAEGGDRVRLEAVACAEVACWSGSDLGVMSAYVKEQVDGIVGAMSPDEYRGTLVQLKRAAPGEFAYTWGDGVRDDWRDGNVSTRLIGAGQWLGGGLQAAGAAVTAPVMCRTGASCHAAGYLFVTGLDASHAGARMLITGQQQPTWGGRALGYLGLSPGVAEFTYGLTQMSPAAYEAYAANKTVSSWISANQKATLSYTNEDFRTLGLIASDATLTTPEALEIIGQYRLLGVSGDDARKYTKELLGSGVQLPNVIRLGPDVELIKLVPKKTFGGDAITPYSPYFISRSQYNKLAKLPADKIADVLGLPAEQGIRGAQLGFDVYSMKPRLGRNPIVFESSVAPVKQGGYSAHGGNDQMLVPNRSEWTDPNANKIDDILGVRYGH